MDIKPLDAILTQLQEQQATIAAKADKLRADLAKLDDERGRIDAAMAALSGVASPSTNGKKKNEKRKAFAPSANKAQVVHLIAEELSQYNVIQEEELKARIEKKLVDTGHARMGYSLRFKEALSDSKFVKGEKGLSLKSRLPSLAHQVDRA